MDEILNILDKVHNTREILPQLYIGKENYYKPTGFFDRPHSPYWVDFEDCLCQCEKHHEYWKEWMRHHVGPEEQYLYPTPIGILRDSEEWLTK